MSKQSKKRMPPATTPEGREKQLISLAVDLAEKQLLEGTASSQVITHYLKLGTTRENIEKEILQSRCELMKAQTESLRSQKRMEELYSEAIVAMRAYNGDDNGGDDEDLHRDD